MTVDHISNLESLKSSAQFGLFWQESNDSICIREPTIQAFYSSCQLLYVSERFGKTNKVICVCIMGCVIIAAIISTGEKERMQYKQSVRNASREISFDHNLFPSCPFVLKFCKGNEFYGRTRFCEICSHYYHQYMSCSRHYYSGIRRGNPPAPTIHVNDRALNKQERQGRWCILDTGWSHWMDYLVKEDMMKVARLGLIR